MQCVEFLPAACHAEYQQDGRTASSGDIVQTDAKHNITSGHA